MADGKSPLDIVPPPDALPIEVNGREIDPREHYARDAKNTNHIVVSVKDVLNEDEQRVLEKLKVELVEDLGDNNLLCRYVPADLTPLRTLEFVRQVDVYRNAYKIPDVLLAMMEGLRGTPGFEVKLPLDVMVHREMTNLEPLADKIAEIPGVDRGQMQVYADHIRLQASLRNLEAIVADDRVRIVEEVVTPVLCDDQAKALVYAPILAVRADCKFTGKGQTIAVCDSGFDLGSREDCHPAFRGKMKRLIPVGRAPDKGLTAEQRVCDPKGHGTHVCGTIVGVETKTSQGLIGGVAQDAEVILSSLEKSDGDLITIAQIASLYQEPYKDGARVHSNSWGDGLAHYLTTDGKMLPKQRPYTRAASDIDQFVCNNPDALICFSAGNNNAEMTKKQPPGTQLASLGSQAAAKNCLTIGASGSTRVVVPVPAFPQPDRFDPDQVMLDSSRGPTLEKRIKPDVVAPGYNIFSAHTRHPKGANYVGPETTSDNASDIGVKWKVRSGTSHSTPLVSGCAAIVRECLHSQGCESPPAALLKALIINGADKLPNVDISAQGFGRVNLQSSVSMASVPPATSSSIVGAPVSPVAGSLIGSPLKQGEKLEFTLMPGPESDHDEFKITMVYNDLPGGQIQNNLNLAVIDSTTGEVKHGGISEDDIDKQNNVEQVVWGPAVPQVPLTVRVTAQKLFNTRSDQDFALAWSISSPLKAKALNDAS